jgi:hypothetical protein
MTRFMAPRYFTQQQNEAVEQALRQLEIGDDEGVRIFIIALEYELAEYEKRGAADKQEKRGTESGAQDTELEKLSRNLVEVARQLGQLPESRRSSLLGRLTAQDRFARIHDRAYLNAVSAELTRIAAVCADEARERLAAGELGEAERHFVGVVAEAYFECFERYPRADGGEPFTNLLQRIVEISGLNISLRREELEPILSTVG